MINNNGGFCVKDGQEFLSIIKNFALPSGTRMSGDTQSHAFSRSGAWTTKSAERFSAVNGSKPTAKIETSMAHAPSFQSSATLPPTQPFQRTPLPPNPALGLQQTYPGAAVSHRLPLQKDQQSARFTQHQKYQQPRPPQYGLVTPPTGTRTYNTTAPAHETLGHSMIQLSKRPRFAHNGTA